MEIDWVFEIGLSLLNKWTVSKWKKYIQQWHKFVYYQQQLRRPIVNVYKIDEKQNI